MDDFAYIEPEEMASFLNDLAYEHFKDNPEIRQKLVQCSAFVHGCVFVMNDHVPYASQIISTDCSDFPDFR